MHNHLFWTQQPSHFADNMLPGFPIHHPILLAVLRLQRAPKQEKQPLLEQQPSWLTWLESDAHYPQEYGRVFNSFNRKRMKCVLLVHFNHINQNRFRLKRLAPIEHDLRVIKSKIEKLTYSTQLYPSLESKKSWLLFKGDLWSRDLLEKTFLSLMSRFNYRKVLTIAKLKTWAPCAVMCFLRRLVVNPYELQLIKLGVLHVR